MNRILLASSSPRRKELMQLLGVTFDIVIKEVEEQIDFSKPFDENAKQLAFKKALASAQDYPDDLIIGCDTIVAIEGQILGKPRSKEDAKEMLRILSGKNHSVCTGVALIHKQQNIEINFCEITHVQMKVLSEMEIDAYVATGEPMDKAGAYGIQGKGAVFIETISGDYYNVVGLPVHRLYIKLIHLNKL